MKHGHDFATDDTKIFKTIEEQSNMNLKSKCSDSDWHFRNSWILIELSHSNQLIMHAIVLSTKWIGISNNEFAFCIEEILESKKILN